MAADITWVGAHTTGRSLAAFAAAATCLLSVAGSGATGATSSTVVSADVPSAVSITNACSDPRGYQLGVLTPGMPATTATDAAACGIEFSSSNDSSMLRAYQADGSGTAMSTSPLAWQRRHAGVGDVLGVEFAPGTTTGWAVGNDGLILRSTNGGASWSPQTCTPCGSQTLKDVTVVSASLAFVGGTSGRVFRFDGTSWSQVTNLGTTADVVKIDAPDANTVWVLAGSTLYRSTNASAATVSWTSFAPVGTTSLHGLDAVSASVAFAVGNSGTVARTIDGGTNWQVTTALGGSLRSVAAASATSAVLVNSGGYAYTTTDGLAWTVTSTGIQELLNDVARIGSVVYAGSEAGRVARSADGGATWTQVYRQPSVGGIRDLAMLDASTIVSGGHGKSLLSSSDAGSTWTWRHSGGTNLGGVAAIDGSAAYAVGDQGAIARTSDGGVNWTPQASPTANTLRAVATTGSSGSRAIAVGDGGMVVTTANGGSSWTVRQSGTSERLLDVEMVDGAIAWAVGEAGTILRSTDAGSSWTTQSSGVSVPLTSIAAPTASTAWAVGGSASGSGTRVILRTTDRGDAWVSQNATSGTPFTAVAATSATTAYAVTLDSRLFRTTTGTGWTSASLGTQRAYSMAVVGPVLFVAGVDMMKRSSDSGATFEDITGVNWQTVVGIDAVDPSSVIGVGARGVTLGPTAVGAAGTVSDYGTAPNSWGGDASASLFAVCLQSVGTGTSPVWTPDTAGIAGRCEPNDADPWRALPTAPSKVATVATPGTTGRATFVFGMRPATTQAIGAYYATVAFEALAPNV